MGKKGLITLVVFVVVAVGTPLFVARHLQLSDPAQSPRSVELPAGASALIAGGKAKLWYACGETGREFEISCNEESRYEWSLDVSPAAEVCGVTVELLEIEEHENRPPLGKFRVSW